MDLATLDTMSKILTLVFILPVAGLFVYELITFVIKINSLIPTI